MKYNLDFELFSKLILESIYNDEINEAICKNIDNWDEITKEQISSYSIEKLKAIMTFFVKTWKNYIVSFKVNPANKNDQKIYELYITVDTKELDENEPKSRIRRTKLYDLMGKFFDDKNFENKKIRIKGKEYVILPASKPEVDELNLKFTNKKDYNLLTQRIIAQPKLSNSSFPIGIYKLINQDNEQTTVELDTIIKFRIEEIDEQTNKVEKPIDTNPNHVKLTSANQVLNQIFGGSKKIITKNTNQIQNFSKNIAKLKTILNEESLEFKTYNSLFGPDYINYVDGQKFDLRSLPPEVKEFISTSNILKVLAEILVPWLLINNLHLGDTDLLKLIMGENYETGITAESVFWPNDPSNKLTDYEVFYSSEVTLNTEEKLKISAKADGGHIPSALSFMINNLKDFQDIKNLEPNSPIDHCIQTIQAVNKRYPNATRVFYCWCIALSFSNNISENFLDRIFNAYRELTRTRKRIKPEDFIEKYEFLRPFYKRTYKLWPYSLTNIFEDIVVKELNESSSSKKVFNSVLTNNNHRYHQVELHKNPSSIITVDCKSPTNDNKTISFTFKSLASYDSNTKDISDLINNVVKSKGSRGAVVGFKLL